MFMSVTFTISDIYQKKLDDFNISLDARELTAKHLIERALLTKEQGFVEAYKKDLDSFIDNPFIIVNDDDTIELNEEAKIGRAHV